MLKETAQRSPPTARERGHLSDVVAAAWGLATSLLREDARSAYQGASEAATATVQMFARAVFTVAPGAFEAGRWLLVAVIFLLVVAPVPAPTRWAVRTRVQTR